jgi:hypothetical protein
MTADIPSVLSKDGIDGLGAVPSVLEESRDGLEKFKTVVSGPKDTSRPRQLRWLLTRDQLLSLMAR